MSHHHSEHSHDHKHAHSDNNHANQGQNKHGGHQHGPNCSHGHGPQIPAIDGYFTKLKQLFNTNRLFFFNEILSGNSLFQALNYLNLGFLNKWCASKFFDQMLMAFLSFASVECLPYKLRPFVAGFYIPYAIFLVINFKYLSLKVTKGSQHAEQEECSLLALYGLSLFFLLLTACTESGNLNREQIKTKSKELIKNKPFLNNPRALCTECEIIKCFRSQHCPLCKQCTSKFSKHSLFLNQCVGSSNELLYLLAFGCMTLANLVTLGILVMPRSTPIDSYFGTKVLIYLLNLYALWQSLVQFLTIFIFNFVYNCTQFEIRSWMYQPYLIGFMKRQFLNPLDIGFKNNLKESGYALFGCEDNEDEKIEITEEESSLSNVAESSTIKPKRKYLTNWSKALFYNGAQLLNHPHRKEIAEKMNEMESKMNAQMAKLEEFKRKISKEHDGKLNPEELTRMAMMQMQMEMQRDMQKAMLERQRQMQLQMQQHQQPETTSRVPVRMTPQQAQIQARMQAQMNQLPVQLQQRMRAQMQMQMRNQLNQSKQHEIKPKVEETSKDENIGLKEVDSDEEKLPDKKTNEYLRIEGDDELI